MGAPLSMADLRILLEGGLATVQLFAGTFVISVIAGIVMGLVRSGRPTLATISVRAVLSFYSGFFRGVPLLVQMLFLFYGTALLGIRLDRFLAASIALSAYGSASMSEIVRAAVDSVPEGQWQAGKMLGMSLTQMLWYVIFPQALQIAIPPTVGVSALLIKSTALASVLGFVDILRAGAIISLRTRQPLIAYLLVAIAFLSLVLPLMIVSSQGERHLRYQR